MLSFVFSGTTFNRTKMSLFIERSSTLLNVGLRCSIINFSGNRPLGDPPLNNGKSVRSRPASAAEGPRDRMLS
jgi:hypothetical protein